jgi:hypothetical protein
LFGVELIHKHELKTTYEIVVEINLVYANRFLMVLDAFMKNSPLLNKSILIDIGCGMDLPLEAEAKTKITRNLHLSYYEKDLYLDPFEATNLECLVRNVLRLIGN